MSFRHPSKVVYCGILALFFGLWPHMTYAQSPEFVPGEVIVKLKPQGTGHALSAKMSAMSKVGGASPAGQILKSWSGINTHKVGLKQGVDPIAYSKQLKSLDDVEYAEPNYYLDKLNVQKSATPIQSYSALVSEAHDFQSGSATAGSGSLNQYYPQVQVVESWQIQSANTAPVVVAVIDSGVDYEHSVFTKSGAIWTNTREIPKNGIDDDRNGFVDDVRGWNFAYKNNDPMDDCDHGTHVAGIILGASQDIFKETLSPAKIKIMPLKFLDAKGRGSTADAISAIMYAVNNGAQVLNNSWGGGGYSQALREAVVYAYSKNRVFVAAAGNASTNNDVNATYPASYTVPNLLSVAASDSYDSLAYFSNYGKQSVHVASPGDEIRSVLPKGSTGFMSGTSMAAPLVSGIAAMMLKENPSMSSHQIMQVISNQSNFENGVKDYVQSDSRVNAYSAVMFSKTGDLSAIPAYPPLSAERNVASMSATTAKSPAGCAAVGLMLPRGGGTGGGPMQFFGMMLLLMSPFMALSYWRAREQKGMVQRRRFDRFAIRSNVTIHAGESDINAQITCISLGGARIATNAHLEKGGLIDLHIQSPDGQQSVDVTGEIVWAEDQQSYGVSFTHLGEQVRETISMWQQSLVKLT